MEVTDRRYFLSCTVDSRVTTDPKSQDLAYGTRLSLTCVVSSFPAVSSSIKWHKDGAIQSSSLSTNSTELAFVTSTFNVSSVDENDGGNYTCYVSSNPAIITSKHPVLVLKLFVCTGPFFHQSGITSFWILKAKVRLKEARLRCHAGLLDILRRTTSYGKNQMIISPTATLMEI